MRAWDADQLQERYAALEALQDKVATEKQAIEDQLRALGRWGRAGRRRLPPTHTPEEAEEAHRMWIEGQRTPWIEAGQRQYQRERRRAYRQAGGS